MPFCSNCGNQVGARDSFCAKCGTRQPIPTLQTQDVLAGISPRTASILCYIPTVGWIACVIVLATQRFRNDTIVRFHAFQGLYLFALWLFVQWAVHPICAALEDSPFIRIDRLMEGTIMGLWIFMIIKAAHEEAYALPLIGDLAQKSAAGK
jgi:uncharacterized membrane protein